VLNFTRILGGIVAALGIFFGIVAYAVAKSAIHEIYAALLIVTGMLGLVVFAVAVGTDAIRTAVREAGDRASGERRNLAEAVKLVANALSRRE